MGSQHTGTQVDVEDIQNLLLEASQWTEDELKKRIPKTLPVVISFLEGSPDAENGVQVARFVLGSFLPHLESSSRNAFALLNSALPQLQGFFTSFMDKCVLDIEGNTDGVNQALQQCLLIIESCLLAVQFLNQAESLCLEKVESLPRSVLPIVNKSLQHCTQSKYTYGDSLESVSETLAELCHQSVDLGVKFSNLVSKIEFDTFNDNDLEGLIFTCEQMCTTASFLSELSDLRSFVSVWRVYASIVCQHYSSLTTSLDAAIPLEALVKEIRNGFQVLSDLPYENGNKGSTDKSHKIFQRTIKTINFCLKIVVSFCEKFRGYLRAAHISIASLLFVLLRFSSGNILVQKIPDDLKKEIASQTTIGIEPLLMHLRNDDDFIKTIFNNKKFLEVVSEDWGTYLLLLVTVAVPTSDIVLIHVKKFLSTVFSVMQKSHVLLSIPCTMEGVMCGGKQQIKVPLYEHVLTRMCVLVANIEEDQFRHLEEVLVEWLLSSFTWPALLATDLWCFIARFGTNSLCWDHCILLLGLLPHTSDHSHQHIMISVLLSRLISKLSSSDKDKFIATVIQERRTSRGKYLSILLRLVQTEENNLQELQCETINFCINNIKSIVSKTADENVFIVLKNDLDSLPQSPSGSLSSDKVNEKEFADILAKLWNRMPEKFIGSSANDQMIASMIHGALLVHRHFTPTQLVQILSLCSRGASDGTSIVCVAITKLISALGRLSILSSPEKDTILDLISECLAGTLKTSNPLVYECALNAFVTFGQHTVYETVLPKCLDACDEKLQERLTMYLKQEPHSIPSDHTRLSLLESQVDNMVDSEQFCENIPIKDIDVLPKKSESEVSFKDNDTCMENSEPEVLFNTYERGTKRKKRG